MRCKVTDINNDFSDLQALADVVNKSVNESTQLEDIFDSSSSTLTMVNSTPELTPREQKAIQMTLQSLFAGTSVYTQMSNEHDDAYFMHKDVDLAKKTGNVAITAAKAIVAAGELVWDNLDDLYARMGADADTMYTRIKALDKRIDHIQFKEPGDEILTFKGLWYVLSVGGKNPRDGHDILNTIKTMTKMCEVVFDKWTVEVQKAGMDMLKAVKDYDPATSNGTDIMQKLNLAAAKLDFGYLQRALSTQQHRDPRYEGAVYVSPALSGDYSLFVYRPELITNASTNVATKANGLRKRSFKIQRTNPAYKIKLDEVKIAPLEAQEIVDIKEAIKKMMTIIEKYAQSGRSKSIVTIGEQMQNHLKREMGFFERNIESLSSNYTASIYRYSGAYQRWASDPMSGLYSQAMALARGALKVCNASISTYQEKEA
jgi:hypothetical protein